LTPKSIAEMRRNQIGALTVRKLKSYNPALSRDFGFNPDGGDKFGLGFQLNAVVHNGGRGEYSMAWAGLANTFFWIDPKNQVCAVLLMQSLPFFDEASIHTLESFETAVYKALQ
jgi:methyl acetate hydrolase